MAEAAAAAAAAVVVDVVVVDVVDVVVVVASIVEAISHKGTQQYKYKNFFVLFLFVGGFFDGGLTLVDYNNTN